MEWMGIGLISGVYIWLIRRVLKSFGVGIQAGGGFVVLVVGFGVGYGLRLTGEMKWINLGYFLTDSSGFVASVLFGVYMMLGQTRYWRQKN